LDHTFASNIVDKLKAKYRFRKSSAKWLQEGQCPDCNEWELYTAAVDPKIVRCGRSNNCGFEISVRNALPDLFEDWSGRFKQSDAEPNAAADAYLRHERGLDIAGLRGAFSQEYIKGGDSREGGLFGSATVRFTLPGGSWWERIIDRPGRFGKKAHFKYGGTWGGHCWAHPEDSFTNLATAAEVWIAEGIFDALALRQNFDRLHKAGGIKRAAVSAMSVNVWPEHFLEGLKQALAGSKNRPLLVFAFDGGKAGVDFTRKFVARARAEGWLAAAAQLRPDGEGEKLDWNDLHLRQLEWRGDEDNAPLGEKKLEEYRWNGDITTALTAREKAWLIYRRRKLQSFDFRFDNRIWWARYKADAEDPAGGDITLEEIANCAFRILYRERDEAADESNFFLEMAFPGGMPAAKARFSAACCAASGEFKKRLFAFNGMWLGSQEQLDRLMRGQTRRLKTVEPIHFTGYSPTHKAWVFGDLAVHDGRVIRIGAEKYFDFGKSAVKLRTDERMLHIVHTPDWQHFDWLPDLWSAWGPAGLIALSFFTLSLFAVQIRDEHASLGFLEIYGEPGSGKTTLVTFLWKLLGRNGYEGFDPNKATSAAIARNFMKVSNLPVGLIESGRDPEKTTHFRQFDFAELLTLYNGRSPRSTGVKNSGTETFEPPFLGAIYLMQNQPVDAMPAVLERIMSLRIDKSGWTGESREAAQRIERWDPEPASGFILHVARSAAAWLECFHARCDHHEEALLKRASDLHNSRIVKCHAQLAAGLDALATLIPDQRLPKAWIEATHAQIARLAVERQLASGADHPVVQRFWDIVDHLLAHEDAIKWGEGNSLNQSRKPGEFYAISLVDFERRARLAGLQPPLDAELKKHLRSSRARKFVGAKSVNNPADRGVHCWVFENPNKPGPLI
jgi:hypothetical protein